jgi:hypothetical protein
MRISWLGRLLAKLPTRPKGALISTLLAVWVCGVTAVTAADVYKWVDENGVTNYTQRPIKGVESKRPRRQIADAPQEAEESAPAAEKPEMVLTEDQQAMLNELKAKEAARLVEVAKIREANCTKSHKVLERLTAKDRIRVREHDGTERVLPHDELQARIADAHQGIATNCQPTS